MNYTAGTLSTIARPYTTILRVTINSRLHTLHNGRYCGMEINLDKTKIMRISRQASPPNIMIIKNQVNHVKYLNSLGSTITNDARCSRAIKFRIVWKKENTFSSGNGL